MKVYDISRTIGPEMVVYKGREEKQPLITNLSNHQQGEVYESKIEMGLHTGTHIDAPLHMLANGDNTSKFEVKEFVGSAQVVDFTDLEEVISASDLNKIELSSTDFILFKTKNSQPGFLKENPRDFIYLNHDAAVILANKGFSGVGIDSLGIEREQPEHETHKTLLKKGIKILEGLDLKNVEAGEYTLVSPPLKIDDVEAAPTRALLLDKLTE